MNDDLLEIYSLVGSIWMSRMFSSRIMNSHLQESRKSFPERFAKRHLRCLTNNKKHQAYPTKTSRFQQKKLNYACSYGSIAWITCHVRSGLCGSEVMHSICFVKAMGFWNTNDLTSAKSSTLDITACIRVILSICLQYVMWWNWTRNDQYTFSILKWHHLF